MRKSRILLCGAILAVAAQMGAAVNHQRVREYRRSVIGKRAVVGAGVGAAIGTARNAPHQWGRSPAGFGKRFGSGLAQHGIKVTIEHGVGHVLHENLHYQRSNLQGTWPRMKYAAKSTFIVPKTNRPGKTFAVGRVSGNLGAGLISQAWKPAAGLGAGVASGGIGIGADVGANMAREFWPRKKTGKVVTVKRR